jgi:hypothetical protein
MRSQAKNNSLRNTPPEAGFGRGWYETNWYLQIFQYPTGIVDMMGLIMKNLTQVPQERFRLR